MIKKLISLNLCLGIFRKFKNI